MVSAADWVSMGALAAAAALALFATLNLSRMAAFVHEVRLGRLASFFAGLAIFAVASLAEALLWTFGEPPARDAGLGTHDVLFGLRHIAFLLALGAMFAALEGGRPAREPATVQAPVYAAWLLVAQPLLLLVEGLLVVVLMVRAIRVHLRRGNLGSLEVVTGFVLLIASRWAPFALEPDGPSPLGVPHLLTSLALLGALGAFVLAVPRSKRTRGRPGA